MTTSNSPRRVTVVFRFGGMKAAYAFEKAVKSVGVPADAMNNEHLGWYVQTDSRCFDHASELVPALYRKTRQHRRTALPPISPESALMPELADSEDATDLTEDSVRVTDLRDSAKTLTLPSGGFATLRKVCSKSADSRWDVDILNYTASKEELNLLIELFKQLEGIHDHSQGGL